MCACVHVCVYVCVCVRARAYVYVCVFVYVYVCNLLTNYMACCLIYIYHNLHHFRSTFSKCLLLAIVHFTILLSTYFNRLALNITETLIKVCISDSFMQIHIYNACYRPVGRLFAR